MEKITNMTIHIQGLESNQPLFVSGKRSVRRFTIPIGCCKEKPLDQKCDACYLYDILSRNYLKQLSYDMRRISGITLSEYGKAKRLSERLSNGKTGQM